MSLFPSKQILKRGCFESVYFPEAFQKSKHCQQTSLPEEKSPRRHGHYFSGPLNNLKRAKLVEIYTNDLHFKLGKLLVYQRGIEGIFSFTYPRSDVF